VTGEGETVPFVCSYNSIIIGIYAVVKYKGTRGFPQEIAGAENGWNYNELASNRNPVISNQ
jgi:hypothetical protein